MSAPMDSLVYVSDRKVADLARARGVPIDVRRSTVADARGRVALPILPGTGLTAEVRTHSERSDAPEDGRTTVRTLERVIAALTDDGLPDLDGGDRSPREGGWVRFHRPLRFGFGCADHDWSVAAAVFVDREPVTDQGLAGLLMTGSPWHLRDPYRPEDGTEIRGARSGSRTGRLFAWLENVRRAHESGVALASIERGADVLPRLDPVDGPPEPSAMYELFARDGWMAAPRFGDLVNPAPCEGVAHVSLVSVCGECTVIFASPLYVRVLPLGDDGTLAALARRRLRLRRSARRA